MTEFHYDIRKEKWIKNKYDSVFDIDRNILGWNFRIMQIEEDIIHLIKKHEEYCKIRDSIKK